MWSMMCRDAWIIYSNPVVIRKNELDENPHIQREKDEQTNKAVL